MTIILSLILLVLWVVPQAWAEEIDCQKPNCVTFALPDIPPGGQVKIGVAITAEEPLPQPTNLSVPFALPETWVPICWEKPPGGSYYLPCAVDELIKKGWLEQRHVAWLERAQEVSVETQFPGGARCFAKMEAALDKMENYISWTPTDTSPESEKWAHIDRLREMLSLIHALKKECGRTP